MTSRIVFSRNARDDLRSILAYISRDNEQRGLTFVGNLEDQIRKRLSTFPESGTKTGHYRVSVFGNYVVIYSYDRSNDVVTIAMVTEGHRNWRAIFEDD